jgi:hypothetical protein
MQDEDLLREIEEQEILFLIDEVYEELGGEGG